MDLSVEHPPPLHSPPTLYRLYGIHAKHASDGPAPCAMRDVSHSNHPSSSVLDRHAWDRRFGGGFIIIVPGMGPRRGVKIVILVYQL